MRDRPEALDGAAERADHRRVGLSRLRSGEWYAYLVPRRRRARSSISSTASGQGAEQRPRRWRCWRSQGVDPEPGTPEALGAYMKRGVRDLGQV